MESIILSAADRLTPFSPVAASVILDIANALNSMNSGAVSEKSRLMYSISSLISSSMMRLAKAPRLRTRIATLPPPPWASTETLETTAAASSCCLAPTNKGSWCIALRRSPFMLERIAAPSSPTIYPLENLSVNSICSEFLYKDVNSNISCSICSILVYYFK